MKYIILLIPMIFIINCSLGQNTKKEKTNYYESIQKLDSNEVKNGENIEKAIHFPIEKFIAYYIENGVIEETKKYGVISIREFYIDTQFIYFGRTYINGFLDFFKVYKSDLSNINLLNLNGDTIRKKFIDQIVPNEDKVMVNQKKKQCSSQNINSKFTYNYKKQTNEVEIIYNWKISCDLIYKIINKTYYANYNINQGDFKK